MNPLDKTLKGCFDFFMALIGLLLSGWIIVIASIIARYETHLSGMFYQDRIGKGGNVFKVMKIRSMKNIEGYRTTVTSDIDPRITKSGRFFRKMKIDELPQLINVLKGDMSLVGPRPDVPGYADRLTGEDRIILSVRPGITGPASIHFKNEEDILASHIDPEKYNREVIWPKKIELNKDYIEKWSFKKDLYYILKTILP